MKQKVSNLIKIVAQVYTSQMMGSRIRSVAFKFEYDLGEFNFCLICTFYDVLQGFINHAATHHKTSLSMWRKLNPLLPPCDNNCESKMKTTLPQYKGTCCNLRERL